MKEYLVYLGSTLVFSLMCLEGMAMDLQSSLISRDEFLKIVASDNALVLAVNRSRDTLTDFETTFKQGLRSTSHFCVVVFQKSGKLLSPVAVQVDKLEGDVYHGRVILNRSYPVLGEAVSVPKNSVVDWRYIDTWRLVGGSVYSECESRLSALKRNELYGVWTQCVHPKYAWKQEDWELIRAIRNGDAAKVIQVAKASGKQSLAEIEVQCHSDWREWHSRKKAETEFVDGLVLAYCGPSVVAECVKHHLLDRQTNKPLGNEPLIITAARFGNVDAISELAAFGFQIDERGKLNKTALMEACFSANPETVQLLIDLGADVNAKDGNGETPIFHVYDPKMVTILHKHGADLTIRNIDNKNCLTTHSIRRKLGVINELIEHGVRTVDGKLWEKYTEAEVQSAGGANRNDDMEQIFRRALEATESSFDAKDPEIKNLIARLRASDEVNYGSALPLLAIDAQSGKILD